MKVISEPEDPKPHRVECQVCGSVIEVEISDCYLSDATMDGTIYSPPMWRTKCPTCGDGLVISTDVWPAWRGRS